MKLADRNLDPNTFTFGEYQGLADATESPIDDQLRDRFKEHLPIMLYVLRNPSFVPDIFQVCDDLKKRVFYGRLNVALHVPAQVAEMMQPTATWTDIDRWWISTPTDYRDQTIRLFHMVLGVISEAGEVIDALITKQGELSDEMVDTVNLGEEMADNLWYVAMGCRAVHTLASLPNLSRPRSTDGFNQQQSFMGLIAIRNLLKLEARHGIDFSKSRVMDRNLLAERQVLEGKALSYVNDGVEPAAPPPFFNNY